MRCRRCTLLIIVCRRRIETYFYYYLSFIIVAHIVRVSREPRTKCRQQKLNVNVVRVDAGVDADAAASLWTYC